MKTGPEVLAEIVSQQRALWKDPSVIGFDCIYIGHEDFGALQTHNEDIGANPVMRRRDLIGASGAEWHRTRVEIKDQREQPEITVRPIFTISSKAES